MTVQTVFDEIHKLYMQIKLNHYTVRSYPQHKALGLIYDAVGDLIDSITEKLVGYSGQYPAELALGTLRPTDIHQTADQIKKTGKEIVVFARSNGYYDIENLGQELSGQGAQLTFLAAYP
jgi:hypothetical protein